MAARQRDLLAAQHLRDLRSPARAPDRCLADDPPPRSSGRCNNPRPATPCIAERWPERFCRDGRERSANATCSNSGLGTQRDASRTSPVPIALKAELQQHADDAVLVILDLRQQALAAAEHHRLKLLDHRRLLEANVFRSGVLEAGLDPARAQNLAQRFQPDLFRRCRAASGPAPTL